MEVEKPLPWEKLEDVREGAWSEESMGNSFLAAQAAIGAA